MTDADLNRIEAALALKLPVSYRRFMLDYPRHLAEKQSDVEKWELANDPDRLIYFNRFVREAAPGEFFDDRIWPPHFFVIGSEGKQNWYFLDLESGTDAVYLFHHEMGDVAQEAASLAEFPDSLLRWWADIERDG